jgi:hypothetical protein
MTDEQIASSHIDLFSNEIGEIIQTQKKLKSRRNSTDICSILKPQSDLYHNSKIQNGVWVNGPSQKARGNSADLLVFKRGHEDINKVYQSKGAEIKKGIFKFNNQSSFLIFHQIKLGKLQIYYIFQHFYISYKEIR